MAGIGEQLQKIDELNRLQKRDQWVNRIHPLVKLFLSVGYIVLTVSVGKYDLEKMLLLAVYPLLTFQTAELSFRKAFRRIRLILPLVLAVGIFNPFLDRIPIGQVGNFVITTGMLSMVTLMLKGVYAVLSAYLLIATTSIEEICYALSLLHVPRILLTVILLIYRYFFVMAEEAERIMTAYQLRAPAQKGLHYKVWGPLVGQWLLRSMDKAQIVYEAMALRGFQGSFSSDKNYHSRRDDMIYLLAWAALLLLLRFVDVIELMGRLFG